MFIINCHAESHLYGTWDYDEIGLHNKVGLPYDGAEGSLYGEELLRLTKEVGLDIEVASNVKRGQTFVWAAGLVHGGTVQKNLELTRLSQVSHYFFEGSDFYWQPRSSDVAKGYIKVILDKTSPIFHRCSTPDYAPHQVHSCADANIKTFLEVCKSGSKRVDCSPLPK